MENYQCSGLAQVEYIPSQKEERECGGAVSACLCFTPANRESQSRICLKNAGCFRI